MGKTVRPSAGAEGVLRTQKNGEGAKGEGDWVGGSLCCEFVWLFGRGVT